MPRLLLLQEPNIMFEWIANLLGLASNFPFRYPVIGLIMALVAAFISWLQPGMPYPWLFLFFAVSTAIWIYFESKYDPAAAFALTIIGFFLTGIGLTMAHSALKMVADSRIAPTQATKSLNELR